MNLRILYHNNCFDGACSASLFTRFHRDVIGTASSYAYQGVMHRPGNAFDPADFSGDENAIVDFKYSPSPRVTWWFDHHQSAFLTPEDLQQFEAQQADGSHAMRHFFDPHYISCTGFISHIAQTKFNYDISPFADLIYWANIIDGAKYESATAAVEMAEPAMKLTIVIESTTDPRFIPTLIPLLTEFSFAEILAQPFVAALVEPLLARHHAAIDLIRDRAVLNKGTITFDITDQPTEGYSKFIPYYLHSNATYVVGLSKSSFRTKISVGTNPWTPVPPANLVNIAAICERYGGGGHARVGAASFPLDREDDARKAAAEIQAELEAADPHLS